MTNFKTKHDELYLEEITSILNTSSRGGIGELDKETKTCVLNIIANLNLGNTELLINLLQLLKNNTTDDDFKSICAIHFEDYGSENLNKIVMRVFKPNICDLILEKYGKNNE
jgi:hypothetical protein